LRDRVDLEHRAGEDQRIDAELEQGIECAALGGGESARGADDGAVATRFGFGFDAVDDFGEEGVVEVGEDDPEEIGPLADQTAGDGVRSVSELGGRLHDELTLLVADDVGASHDERDHRFGDAGACGDVDDGGASGRDGSHGVGVWSR
jgi:hypothetical protein